MTLFGLNFSGIAGPENLGEVDSLPLDDIKPLVGRKLRTAWGQEDLTDDVSWITGPLFEEVKDDFEISIKSASHDRSCCPPRKVSLVNDRPRFLKWRCFVVIQVISTGRSFGMVSSFA